jgi:hypothetical protein
MSYTFAVTTALKYQQACVACTCPNYVAKCRETFENFVLALTLVRETVERAVTYVVPIANPQLL